MTYNIYIYVYITVGYIVIIVMTIILYNMQNTLEWSVIYGIHMIAVPLRESPRTFGPCPSASVLCRTVPPPVSLRCPAGSRSHERMGAYICGGDGL